MRQGGLSAGALYPLDRAAAPGVRAGRVGEPWGLRTQTRGQGLGRKRRQAWGPLPRLHDCFLGRTSGICFLHKLPGLMPSVWSVTNPTAPMDQILVRA